MDMTEQKNDFGVGSVEQNGSTDDGGTDIEPSL